MHKSCTTISHGPYLDDWSKVPAEIADLTGLSYLDLSDNQLTGVPTEFRTWGPTYPTGSRGICSFAFNEGFSCANVGFTTACCTSENCDSPSYSPCYMG